MMNHTLSSMKPQTLNANANKGLLILVYGGVLRLQEYALNISETLSLFD